MSSKKTSGIKTTAASKTIDGWTLADGQFSPAKVGVVTEKELPVYLNGEHLITASLAPGMEREFVVGYLFGQGFIEGIEELTSLDIENNAARVTIKDKRKASPVAARTNYRIVSGGGRTAYFETTDFRKINSNIQISKENIFRAMNTLFDNATLYAETEGVHAAGLFAPTADPLCIVEDIGRHNTLDKVIGYALPHKLACPPTLLG